MIIGIDFGTCFSSVAIMNGSKPVTNYMKDPNRTGTPTLFMYSKDMKKELFGYECLSGEGLTHSSDIVRYIKRDVRNNPNNLTKTVTSGDKDYPIHTVLEKYLTYLLGEARTAANRSGDFIETYEQNFESVTITAPVGIAGGQMTATDYNQLIRDIVVKVTGLPKDKVFVLEEPIAAAISYLYAENIRKRYTEKQSILVFDLGGGTLDVTIVDFYPDKNEYRIRVKEGDLTLGGNDWDQALTQDILRKAGLNTPPSDPEERQRLADAVMQLKHGLTDNPMFNISFKCNGKYHTVYDYTREQFESVTEHLLDRAIELTDEAIDKYSVWGVSEIDKIILVGGSCNMPQITKRMLEEYPELGEDGIITHDPSLAICKGAAIFSKLAPPQITPDYHNNNSEKTRIKVCDIASRTYGFDSTRKGESMIYNLLFKDTPFDENGKIVVKSPTSFIALKDDQKRVAYTVYESDAAPGIGDDQHWMRLDDHSTTNGMKVTVDIPPAYLGKATKYSQYVTFVLDTNGILELIITDVDGKQVGYAKQQV